MQSIPTIVQGEEKKSNNQSKNIKKSKKKPHICM